MYGQQSGPQVIPMPATWTEGTGDFSIPWNLTIYCADPTIIPSVKVFVGYLYSRSGIVAQILPGKPKYPVQAIVIETVKGSAEESYFLEISPRQVSVMGNAKGGAFYGLISILQSMNYQHGTWMLRCGTMSDLPRMSYRGMHLDVARHFVAVDSVKRFLDFMALYKFNTFHWHLTDDQGWRIEIKKYPELTQRGAWRDHTQRLKSTSLPDAIEKKWYGGFYTQEQIRQIVKYAEERNISIIPEVDMPGHTMAVLASYPHLSCEGKRFQVPGTWGIFQDVMCMRDETFRFIDGVIQELVGLFPSPYIHIGGDECPVTTWALCSRCKRVMERENITDVKLLQGWFTSKVATIVRQYGKKVMAWDEVLESSKDSEIVIMNWRDSTLAARALLQGNPIVMSPGTHCYFDHYQGDPGTEPLAHGGFTPIEKVYGFRPEHILNDTLQLSKLWGAQGNLWSEYLPHFTQVEYMALPRMCALAEVVWTAPEKKNWESFRYRLQHQMSILDHWRVNYSRSLFAVGWELSEDSLGRGVFLNISHSAPAYIEIQRGRERFASIYHQPVLIEKPTQIRAWQGGPVPGPALEKYIHPTAASRMKIVWNTPPDPPHVGLGTFTLKDGYISMIHRDWVGFREKDVSWEVIPKSTDTIHSVSLAFLSDHDSWIHLPTRILIYHVEEFRTTLVAELLWIDSHKKGITWMQLPVQARTYKKLRIQAESRGRIPMGSPGAGHGSWIFCGEMRINE